MASRSVRCHCFVLSHPVEYDARALITTRRFILFTTEQAFRFGRMIWELFKAFFRYVWGIGCQSIARAEQSVQVCNACMQRALDIIAHSPRASAHVAHVKAAQHVCDFVSPSYSTHACAPMPIWLGRARSHDDHEREHFVFGPSEA